MLAITVDMEDWYHFLLVTGSPFSRFRDSVNYLKDNAPLPINGEDGLKALEIATRCLRIEE